MYGRLVFYFETSPLKRRLYFSVWCTFLSQARQEMSIKMLLLKYFICRWCNTCSSWRKELEQSTANIQNFRKIDWHKLRSSDWPLNHVSISYVFVHSGWIKDPPEIDISDIGTQLCIWDNCKEFNISKNVSKKVREVRNKYFAHNSAAEITDQRLTIIFNVFYTLSHETDITSNIDCNVFRHKLSVLEDDPIYGSKAEQQITELKETLKRQDIKLNTILDRTEHESRTRTRNSLSWRHIFKSILSIFSCINFMSALYLVIIYNNILPGTINLLYSNPSPEKQLQEHGKLNFLS